MPVACKPKHDYQGLLGMGWGVVGVYTHALGCATVQSIPCWFLHCTRVCCADH